MRENAYQAHIMQELKRRFVGCVVLKNDSAAQQGIPDLLILFSNKWAALEVKQSYLSPHQPNQDYWVDTLDQLSFASFINPENEDHVMSELSTLFRGRRVRRVTERING